MWNIVAVVDVVLSGSTIVVVFVVVTVVVLVVVIVVVVAVSDKDRSERLLLAFKDLIVHVGCACCKHTLQA